MARLRDTIKSDKTDAEWDDFYNRHLDSIKQEFESGDGYALFRAIAFCGNEKIIMPEWVVQALYDGMRKFAHYKVKTLDAAFGITWPHKNISLKTLEERRRWSLQILTRVSEYSVVGWPIDIGTFEMVAKEFGLKPSKIRDIYYAQSTEVRKKVLDETPRNPRRSTPTPVPKV